MNSEYMRFFPKSACYPNQKEAMKKIHTALLDRKIVLFEGACGTGKTLSALVPALDAAQRLKKVVIIATNVHQQMLQFTEESREIKQKQDIKAVVLKGKKYMCPLDEDYETCSVLRENTYELIEKEKELTSIRAHLVMLQQESAESEIMDQLSTESKEIESHINELRSRYCSYLYNVAVSDISDFSTWYFEYVRTPEDVNDWAYEKSMCGYELVKRQMSYAELIICNFHHILNFDILANLLDWMDKSVDDVIVIFDEAHNLESAARGHSSIVLPEYSLMYAIEELTANEIICQHNACRIDDLKIFFNILLRHLKETYDSRMDFGERERLTGIWKDISICDPKQRNDYFLKRFLDKLEDRGIKDIKELLDEAVELGRYLDEFYKTQYKSGGASKRKKSQLLRSAEFISFYLEHSNDYIYYPILNIRRVNDMVEGRIELVACIPKNITGPLFESLFSSVLMSATLQPFDVTSTSLAIHRPVEKIAYGPTFPEDNRLTIAVKIPPLFARDREDPVTVNRISQILNDIIQYSKGNILVFFQSYHEARMYRDRIRTEIPIYLDEIGIPSQDIRDEFFMRGESDEKAVMISYLWGTLTEGVDYKGGRGRTVVIVGVGYPALNERMHAIEYAYEHEFPGMGWEFAIQVPTIRRVRQAMGRVIRSPEDYGVRVLLDGRYTASSVKRWRKYSVYNSFVPEERSEIIDIEPENIKYSLMNFFLDMQGEDANSQKDYPGI